MRTLTELIEIAAPSAESLDGAAVAVQSAAAAEEALSVEASMPAFFSSPEDAQSEVSRIAARPTALGLMAF